MYGILERFTLNSDETGDFSAGNASSEFSFMFFLACGTFLCKYVVDKYSFLNKQFSNTFIGKLNNHSSSGILEKVPP